MPRVDNLEELRALKPEIEAITSDYGLKDLRVFGSIVRGEMSEGSDVDFLATWPEPQQFSYFDLFDCQRQLQERLGRQVEIIDPQNISYWRLKKQILSEAVTL
jgi:hypothetical protein